MIDALIGTILFLLAVILIVAAWIAIDLLIELEGRRRDNNGQEG